MKILHTADWHLGELPGPVTSGQNARMLDTIHCIDFLIEKAGEEKPDVVLISGDLFNRSKLWADQMLREINIATHKLRALAAIAPTVLLYGTKTHDNREAFQNIRGMNIKNLTVVTEPKLLSVSGLQIVAVPGTERQQFASLWAEQSPPPSPEEQNEICSREIVNSICNLVDQVNTTKPSVLLSHYSVSGASYNDKKSVIDQNEIVLDRYYLEKQPFTLVCLGHIHKPQNIRGTNIFYPGTVNRIKADEEGQDKGFWVHDISDNKYCGSKYILTPAREFYTLKLDEFYISAIIEKGSAQWLFEEDSEGSSWFPSPDEKIVRVHYSCSDELAKQFNKKALERELLAAGAFHVHEIIPKRGKEEIDKDALSETADPMVNLKDWLFAQGHTVEDVLRVMMLAQPLVDAVSAKMPAGKLSGIFKPKRIEVRSYRSFVSESFDFSQIGFATVNGPNGVGKSALFMDAICDCLFEETREGDIFGWISNGPKVKSGAITFEFSMGDTGWRVSRTRSKSGSVTLNLEEYINGSWESRNGDTKNDTQAKIVSLLGMDATTFRCCALIMQDAYGVFLEADKTERMEVLANILGLNVYEMLKDAADKLRKSLRSDLEKKKGQIEALAEKVGSLDQLIAVSERTGKEIADNAEELKAAEKDLAGAEKAAAKVEQQKARVKDIAEQMAPLRDELVALGTKRIEYAKTAKTAEEFLSRKEEILDACAEYERLKALVAELKAKDQQQHELQNTMFARKDESLAAESAVKHLEAEVSRVKAALSRRDELKGAVEKHAQALKDLEAQDSLAQEWAKLNTQALEARVKMNTEAVKNDSKKKRAHSDLEQLKNKAAMLANSECVDPENARCRFLADALEAKVKIPEMEKLLADWDESHIGELQEQHKALQAQRDDLKYDHTNHTKVKGSVKALQAAADEYRALEGKDELLRTMAAERERAVKQRDGLSEELYRLRSLLVGLDEELEPLKNTQETLEDLAPYLPEKEHIPVAREQLKNSEEAISLIDKDVAAKTEQYNALVSKRQEVIAWIEAQETPDTEGLRRAVKSCRDTLNSLYAELGGVKARIEELKKADAERRALQKEIEPLALTLTDYQVLVQAFGFDGIPFKIVGSVVLELSRMANDILGEMTGGKMSLEMKTHLVQKSTKREVNALEIYITDYQRGELPYKSRSGGQRVKAALSVAFALADLKANRAGIQLGMMFVDEPPFLDEEGVDAYCDALRLLYQRYQGLDMKVIGISHDPRMKARFPQQIEVVDTGEAGSKVKLVGVA